MAAGCVIGVDLGGTKLLAGRRPSSRCTTGRIAGPPGRHRRADRPARRSGRARRSRRRRRGPAVGFGIPSLIDPATRHRAGLQPPAAARRRGRATCCPSGSGCRSPSTTTPTRAMLAEWRCGAARGREDAIMLTLGTGIGGGLIVRRAARPRRARRGGRARPHGGRRSTGRPARGAARTTAAWRRSRRARDRRARGCGVAREAADIGARARAGGRARDHGRARHRARPRRRSRGARRDRRSWAGAWASASSTLVNIFNPEVIVVGGGAIAAGELLLAPGARGGRAPRAAVDARRRARWCRRASARSPGCSGRPAWRSSIAAVPRRMTRAADRLPDADRQPRGRHAARALGAARRRRDRLRGHAHDEGAARPLRRVGRARALRRARRARAWRRGWSSGCAPGAVVALVSDAGMPLVSDPGLVLVQACVAAGLEVEVLPGPSAALAALVAAGMPAATWRFVGFLPRKWASWRRCSRRPRRSWPSSRRGEWRLRWRCSPSWIPSGRSRCAAS